MPDSGDFIDHLALVYKSLYPERSFSGYFKPQDEDFLLRETTDVISGAPVLSDVQQVAAACNDRRDAHAAFLIQQDRAAGMNGCYLFGGPHFERVVALVPAFRGHDVLELRAD